MHILLVIFQQDTFNKTPIGTFNLQVFVNNIFNKEYIANGWAATDTFADGSSINYIGYYPGNTQLYDTTHASF